MVRLRRLANRAALVLGVFVAVSIVLAAIGAAQPSTLTPSPTTPPTSSQPVPAGPESGGGVHTNPGGAFEGEDSCQGHIRIPGIDVCTPVPDPGEKAKDAVVDASRAFLSDIVDWVLRGYLWITKYVWQLFVDVDVDASGSTSTVQRINDMTGELQVIAAGLGLLVALIQILTHRMMLTGDDAAPEAFAGFLRWALAASLAAPSLLALSAASDALAMWIFTTAAGPEGPTHVVDALSSALSGRDARLKTEDVIALALCLLGLLGYLELAIQLYLQKAWMIYCAVALPIAGAASVTGAGKAVFSAMLRLGVTVLLFKPIAALLLAVGFWQIRELNSSADVVTAVLVMTAPAFCMPVLANLIGNTSVGFAGTPMLRGIYRTARPTRQWMSNRADSIATGWREGMARAEEKDANASASRANARAANTPSNSAATTPTTTSSSATNKASAASAPGTTTTTPAAGSRATNSASATSTGRSTGSTRTRASGSSPSAGPGTGGSTASRPRQSAAGAGSTRTSASGTSAATGTASTSTPSSSAANRVGGRSANAADPAATSSATTPQWRRGTRRTGPPRDTTFRRIT
ncbi:hypothetical protein [Nocardia abscessus]|uniref:hypothetical protein n=1 Tax=Nocardia abscessus TaxID=120957 RepID=UPI002456E022|nr:hypothetical protein [Nocardia abscessus]